MHTMCCRYNMHALLPTFGSSHRAAWASQNIHVPEPSMMQHLTIKSEPHKLDKLQITCREGPWVWLTDRAARAQRWRLHG